MNEDSVSREEFERVVQVLLLRIQALAELWSNTSAIFAVKGTISPEELQAVVNGAGRTETGQKLKRALADLEGFEAIRNVLRAFEGPLQ